MRAINDPRALPPHGIELLFWLVLAVAVTGLIAAVILYAEPY